MCSATSAPLTLIRWSGTMADCETSTRPKRDVRKRPVANSPKQRYSQQRKEAFRRGIPFLLTFDDWWKWWQEDGRWLRRGRNKESLVMARYGDVGPYELGNIYATTQAGNQSDVSSDARSSRRAAGWARGKALGKIPFLAVRETHPQAKPVITPAGTFPSIALAAEHHGISRNVAERNVRLRRRGWQPA